MLAAAPAFVHELHHGFAWFVVVGNGLTGTWALAADRWKVLRRRELWWAVWVAQISVFVQVILGVIVVQGFKSDHLRMHMFYGFVAAFSVAIIYSYRSQLAHQRYRFYGAGGLFLMGLGIRAMVLNPLR